MGRGGQRGRSLSIRDHLSLLLGKLESRDLAENASTEIREYLSSLSSESGGERSYERSVVESLVFDLAESSPLARRYRYRILLFFLSLRSGHVDLGYLVSECFKGMRERDSMCRDELAKLLAAVVRLSFQSDASTSKKKKNLSSSSSSLSSSSRGHELGSLAATVLQLFSKYLSKRDVDVQRSICVCIDRVLERNGREYLQMQEQLVHFFDTFLLTTANVVDIHEKFFCMERFIDLFRESVSAVHVRSILEQCRSAIETVPAQREWQIRKGALDALQMLCLGVATSSTFDSGSEIEKSTDENKRKDEDISGPAFLNSCSRDIFDMSDFARSDKIPQVRQSAHQLQQLITEVFPRLRRLVRRSSPLEDRKETFRDNEISKNFFAAAAPRDVEIFVARPRLLEDERDDLYERQTVGRDIEEQNDSFFEETTSATSFDDQQEDMSGSFDPSTSLSFHPSLREGKSISFEQYLKNTRNRSPNIQAEELESNDDASASSSIRSSSTKSASSLHSVSDSYRSFPVNSVSLRPPGPHDSDYLDDRRPSSSDLRDSMSSSTRRQPLAEEFFRSITPTRSVNGGVSSTFLTKTSSSSVSSHRPTPKRTNVDIALGKRSSSDESPMNSSQPSLNSLIDELERIKLRELRVQFDLLKRERLERLKSEYVEQQRALRSRYELDMDSISKQLEDDYEKAVGEFRKKGLRSIQDIVLSDAWREKSSPRAPVIQGLPHRNTDPSDAEQAISTERSQRTPSPNPSRPLHLEALSPADDSFPTLASSSSL